MKKLVAGVGAAIAAGLTVGALVLAPNAMAADETGPDSVACAQANAAVLQAALKANAVADDIQAGQDQVLADLKAKLLAAQAAYDAVYAKYQATPATATLDELVAAQAKLKAAVDALTDAPGVPAADKAKLLAAQAALKLAIEKRATACEFTLPTVTATPSVTVTVTPAPTTTVPVPSAIDTGKP